MPLTWASSTRFFTVNAARSDGRGRPAGNRLMTGLIVMRLPRCVRYAVIAMTGNVSQITSLRPAVPDAGLLKYFRAPIDQPFPTLGY